MSTTATLARFIAETTLEQVPSEVVRIAKDLVLDTVGVALAGSVQPSSRIAIGLVRDMGGRPRASVIGGGFKTAAANAALANGTSAAALDYDDTSFVMLAHPSGVLLPATLAVGEEIGASGRDLLEAYVLGHEAASKVGRAIQPAAYLGGRHTTGTVGVMGAAAACAKLLKLDAERTAVALGAAASLAGALRANMGTMTKPLHSGHAAQGGVLAAMLAARGFTAATDILENRYGYCRVMVGGGNYRLEAITEQLGNPWNFVSPGVGVKLYPSGTMAFCGIECTLDMVREYDIRPQEVEAIEYAGTSLALDIAPCRDPKTANEAMYCIPWALAVSVFDRQAEPKQFAQERVDDAQVHQLVQRVKLGVHPELKDLTDPHDTAACYVTIRLRDGREYTRFRRRPRAYPGGEPWTKEVLQTKYRQCAALALPPEAIAQSISLLERLEELPNIGVLMEVLRG